MPVTLEDLIDANRRLADSNFATAAAINKLVPAFQQLSRDIYDLKASREIDQPSLQLVLGQLKTDLAVIINDAKRTAGDVRELQREVTGAFSLQKMHDERTAIERIIDRMESAKTSTKVLAAFLLLAFGLGGFGHLIFSLLMHGGG
jgi:hypothetical protein